MTDPSESNIRNAISWAIGWIDKVNRWANDHDKPLILEEFGMPRDNFQARDKLELYSPKWSTSRKDQYFQSVISRVVEHYKLGGSFTGFGFWAFRYP